MEHKGYELVTDRVTNIPWIKRSDIFVIQYPNSSEKALEPLREPIPIYIGYILQVPASKAPEAQNIQGLYFGRNRGRAKVMLDGTENDNTWDAGYTWQQCFQGLVECYIREEAAFQAEKQARRNRETKPLEL